MGLEAIANQTETVNARKAAAEQFFRGNNQPAAVYNMTEEESNTRKQSIFDILKQFGASFVDYAKKGGAVAYAGGKNNLVDGGYSASRQAMEYEAKLSPEARKLHDQGFIFNQKKQLDKAVEKYKQAIKIDPDNPLLHDQLGIVYNKKKEFHLATESFKNALNIIPNYSNSHFALGFIYHRLGDKENSTKHLETYLRLSPDSPYKKRCLNMMSKR